MNKYLYVTTTHIQYTISNVSYVILYIRVIIMEFVLLRFEFKKKNCNSAIFTSLCYIFSYKHAFLYDMNFSTNSMINEKNLTFTFKTLHSTISILSMFLFEFSIFSYLHRIISCRGWQKYFVLKFFWWKMWHSLSGSIKICSSALTWTELNVSITFAQYHICVPTDEQFSCESYSSNMHAVWLEDGKWSW